MSIRVIFLSAFVWLLFSTGFAITTNPCDDSSAFSLTDRGSITDTPCVVPQGNVLVQGGYQTQDSIGGGSLQNFPQTEISLGLPMKSEVYVLVPNYYNRSFLQHTFQGAGPAIIGVKKEVAFGQQWTVAAQGLAILPGGSANFGAEGLGLALNGIASINLTAKTSLAFMLGGSATRPKNFGGRRNNSFNPSVALSFNPVEHLSLFAEIFGQTKTAPEWSGGFNGDIGFLYAASQLVVLDIEVGHRLNGMLGGYNSYIGGGLTVLLG